MRVFSARMDIRSSGQERVWALTTSFVSMIILPEIKHHILSGFRSRLEREIILEPVRDDGSNHPYRLTITLDSLAGLEKNESGMTTTAKNG